MNWIGAATLATTRFRAHGLDRSAWSRSRGREAESASFRLDHLPPDEVVPRVGERVVRVRRSLRQPRPPHVLPALPQVPGEPGQRPWQRRHRAPQLGQRDMVVRGDPRPQLQLTPVGLVPPEKGHQVLPDPGPRPPCRVTRGWQFRQHVLPHPGAGAAGVELGGHGVELAAFLVDDADRHEVDRHAVLDELAVVEVPHAWTLSVAADQPALVSGTRPVSTSAARRGITLSTASGGRFALSRSSLTFAAYTSTYSWPESSIRAYMISSVIDRSTNRSPASPS